MAASEPEKRSGGRSLGNTEVFYQTMVEQVGASMYMHVAVIDSSHLLSPNDVRRAFRVLVSKQEALQMRIERTDENDRQALKFVPCENVDDFEMDIVKIAKTDDWIHLVTKENYERIDSYTGPLFKVILAKVEKSGMPDESNNSDRLDYKYVVILKLHHAIADAKSAFDVIYRQFLPILSAVVNKRNPENATPFVHLSKPCEEFFGHMGRSVPWYLKLILGFMRWKNRTFGGPPIFAGKYPDDPDLLNIPEDKMTQMPLCYPVRFSKELTASILSSAKSHGVTVHAVLLGACSIAFCATCHEASIEVPSNVTIAWPTDLRKFLDQQTPLPLGSITGNGMSHIKPKLDHTPDKFWQMCHKISEGIKKQTKKEVATGMMGFNFINYVMEAVREETVEKVMPELGFSGFFVLSNLGNCDVGPKPNMSDGDVHLCMTEEYFSVSGVSNRGNVPFFHAVSTFKGQLLWNAGYNKGSVSEKFVRHYLSKVQETCAKYCQ